MARGYYRHPGRKNIQMRSGNGQFRRNKLSDFVDGVNEKGLVFICNVCNREFIPVLLSGLCCEVDNKRLKEPEPEHPEVQALLDKIDAIRKKPFINRQDLEDISALDREVYAARLRNKQHKDGNGQ